MTLVHLPSFLLGRNTGSNDTECQKWNTTERAAPPQTDPHYLKYTQTWHIETPDIQPLLWLASRTIPLRWLILYDSMPLWIEHQEEIQTHSTRMLSVLCACVIDIHRACTDTFPYETLASPEESTCEALHPAVGYQKLSTPFDSFKKSKTFILKVIDSDLDWKSGNEGAERHKSTNPYTSADLLQFSDAFKCSLWAPASEIRLLQ